MKFLQTLIPAAGLLSTAAAWGKNHTGAAEPPVVTVITTDYTTYCPYPTTFIHHNVTYTATEETTLTITNCPCTVTTKHAPPHVTTDEHDATVTVTNPPETIIADCTPVGPDGKPTPTHEAPVPGQPGQPGHEQPSQVPVPPPVASHPGEEATTPAVEQPTGVAPPATESSAVQVSPNGAEKIGTGFGVAVAGLVAALL